MKRPELNQFILFLEDLINYETWETPPSASMLEETLKDALGKLYDCQDYIEFIQEKQNAQPKH